MTYRGRAKERRRAQHRALVRYIMVTHPDSFAKLLASYVRALDRLAEKIRSAR